MFIYVDWQLFIDVSQSHSSFFRVDNGVGRRDSEDEKTKFLETPSSFDSTFESNNAGHFDIQSRYATSVTKLGEFHLTDANEDLNTGYFAQPLTTEFNRGLIDDFGGESCGWTDRRTVIARSFDAETKMN